MLLSLYLLVAVIYAVYACPSNLVVFAICVCGFVTVFFVWACFACLVCLSFVIVIVVTVIVCLFGVCITNVYTNLRLLVGK